MKTIKITFTRKEISSLTMCCELTSYKLYNNIVDSNNSVVQYILEDNANMLSAFRSMTEQILFNKKCTRKSIEATDYMWRCIMFYCTYEIKTIVEDLGKFITDKYVCISDRLYLDNLYTIITKIKTTLSPE